MILNEKIKASEVELAGIDGEDLGIMPTSEALALAKQHKVDLVCLSLMTSPPQCRLMRKGNAKEEAQQKSKRERAPKLKEIRFTPQIEDHDFETKKQQAGRILKAGNAVLLTVSIKGKEGAKAKELLETLVQELSSLGRKKTGIQLSGKQASVQLDPVTGIQG